MVAYPETIGELGMFTTKLNSSRLSPLRCWAVLAASTEAALAGNPVPAPVIGAGLPVLAILAGGYWLIRKVRERR